MKVELKEGEGLVRELSVEVPSESVSAAMEKKFDEVRRSVTLKGFRKGKAPLSMIKSVYADEVKADVVDDLIKSTYPEAVKEKTLQVASRPTVTNLNFNDDGGFVYTAQVEVFPEVGRISLENLEITSGNTDVSDADVDAAVLHLRKQLVERRPVTREIRADDFVVVDLKKLTDPSMAVKATAFPNAEIDLSSKLTVKEFARELPGMKAGDKKEIEVEYESASSDPSAPGPRVKYLCEVKEVKEQILPELDDGFAKRVGVGETLLEMRLKIREDIAKQNQAMLKRAQKAQIVKQVCQSYPLPIPEAMIQEYVDSVVEDHKKSYPDADEAELRKEYRPIGTDAMRWDILWHKLAEQEQIEVSSVDTETWINGFAARNGMTPEQAQQALSRSGKVNQVRDSLLEEKVLEFLLGRAKLVPAEKADKE